MRVGEVIGKVTLAKCHPSISGGTWLVGSAGHQSPVGLVANTKHKIQFGFHPGMHR